VARSGRNQSWLLNIAKNVAEQLKPQLKGSRVRIRIPRRASYADTDGWMTIVGDLGPGQPRLEIWLDRFTGHRERKLYACLYSKDREKIVSITKRIISKLRPRREITWKDLADHRNVSLSTPMKLSEFSYPILEKYDNGHTYYGLYDPRSGAHKQKLSYFSAAAAAFFVEVISAIPTIRIYDDETIDAYPRVENRMHVRSHLHRDRSPLLALYCKQRDKFTCQICHFNFESTYGPLGKGFAEAHHRIPLSKLRRGIRTRLQDLTTVCANCHRVLHLMTGKQNDVPRLRAIIKRQKMRRPRQQQA
jgi:5-methylcytosine-specific restriction endonuclease McrA